MLELFEGIVTAFFEKQFPIAGAAIAAAFFVLWHADKVVWSKKGAADLQQRFFNADRTREVSLAVLAPFISHQAPASIFLRRVFLVSLVSLVVFSLFFVATMAIRTPEIYARFLSQTESWPSFASTLLWNGFVVVVVVNWVSYFTYPWMLAWISQSSSGMRASTALVADLVFRCALFFVVTAAIYALSAITGDGVGENVVASMRLVPVTLASGMELQNLAGVFFYAALFGAFPIYALAIAEAFRSSSGFGRAVRYIFFLFPFAARPIRSSMMVFGVFAIAVVNAGYAGMQMLI